MSISFAQLERQGYKLQDFLALPASDQEECWRKLQVQIEFDRAVDEAHEQGLAGPSIREIERRLAPKPEKFAEFAANDVVKAEKERLLAIRPRAYVERLTGVSAPHSGFIRCVLPDHDDSDRGNFKVYEETGWWCYACGVGGGIYQLGAHLWGYSLPLRGDGFKAVHGELVRLLLPR